MTLENPGRRTLLKSTALFSLSALAPPLVAVTNTPLMTFRPVSITEGRGSEPAISPDYQYQVLFPWGTPIEPGGPGFRYPPSAEHQRVQTGIGHDGMCYFQDSEAGGLLVMNHEYGRNPHVLGKSYPESLEDVRVSQAALGVSVLGLSKQSGRWRQTASAHVRRIHVETPVQFSGPASGDPRLVNPAGNPPAGTFSNCAYGRTPWNTYLTCEENFDLYFGADDALQTSAARQRYGLTKEGGGYGWHRFDPRFDLSNQGYRNEVNRFGWVMEVDPFDAVSVPLKHSALGRFKHEGATVTTLSDGRVVVYMGDDSRFEFIYRFRSKHPWQEMFDRGVHPLSDGTLQVARFDDDGGGEWLTLSVEDQRLRHFGDQAGVLINARLAASALGATPMDRPEWITTGHDGALYCSLTNNTHRTEPNAANPAAPNIHGHIVRIFDHRGRTGDSFQWEIFLEARHSYLSEQSFSSPDGLWADPEGRLFIETDGDQRAGLNNQLLVADTRTGEVRRLLTGAVGCEITGIAVTPERDTLFVNLQHIANGDPSLTSFPAESDGRTVPRDCTLAISRRDGGVVGS